MVPKPFPYPLGVGIDVCQVHRVASFLRTEDSRNRWARRVFTRLEWPAVLNQYLMTQRTATEEQLTEKGKDWMMRRKSHSHPDDSVWNLPELPPLNADKGQSMFGNEYYKATSNERSSISQLGRYLAGRWAAKEAAIKAHSRRRLYMSDISIVTPKRNPDMFSKEMSQSDKAVALIEPECNTVLLDERVAHVRKLRGFAASSARLQKGPLFPDMEASSAARQDAISADPRRHCSEKLYFVRRAKVREADRQIAEVNISHDGNTAVAVCMAVTEPNSGSAHEYLIDDGRGPPIHEPQFGDEGWFEEGQLPTYNNKPLINDTSADQKDETEVTAQKKAVNAFLAASAMKLPFLP